MFHCCDSARKSINVRTGYSIRSSTGKGWPCCLGNACGRFPKPRGRCGETVSIPTAGVTTEFLCRTQRPRQAPLKLIRVAAVRLRVFAPGEAFGNSKRRVQAALRFDGVPYALWITDPVIERRYLPFDDGHYDLPESYLTVSLGEPFGDYCYKLIAAVMVRP